MPKSLISWGFGALFILLGLPVSTADPNNKSVGFDPTSVVDMEDLGKRNMINQTPAGTSGVWTIEKLNALTQEEGIALWKNLPTPTVEEMNGHYRGMGPDGGNLEYQKRYAEYMFNENSVRGYWLGKAFRPLSASEGQGYNRWRFTDGHVERNLLMKTRIDSSVIDGKPAYVLDYSAFNKTTLYDEIRKLEDGIYIGTATVMRDGKRNIEEPDMFILVGPTDEWVGAPYTLGPTPLKDGVTLPTE